MKKLACTIAAITSLSACESHDLRVTGNNYLAPLGEKGTYRWKTGADPVYPLDSPKAEAARIRQMEIALSLSAVCQNGYTIENRQSTRKVKGILGGVHDVFYTLRCK